MVNFGPELNRRERGEQTGQENYDLTGKVMVVQLCWEAFKTLGHLCGSFEEHLPLLIGMLYCFHKD